MFLHISATTLAVVGVTFAVIFLLIFAMSFAFGSVPEGGRRLRKSWTFAWRRASRIAVAGLFAGVLLAGALACGTNDGGSTAATSCDKTLPPLTGNAVTDLRIRVAIDAMGQISAAADQSDATNVRSLFYTSDAHNLTHDIDQPLRQQSPDAARQLCEKVIVLENEMVGQIDGPTVSKQANDIALLLVQARPMVNGARLRSLGTTPQPCQQPLQAVSSQTLTAERLQAAINQMSLASRLAGEGKQNDAEAAFNGDAHNITHDIDGPLRAADQQLAVDLCLSVLAIELHLGNDYDAGVMLEEASASAGLLQQAGQELGILN
jgi:hypothetical protein